MPDTANASTDRPTQQRRCNAYEYACGDPAGSSDISGTSNSKNPGGGSYVWLFCKQKNAKHWRNWGFHAQVDIKCTLPDWWIDLLNNEYTSIETFFYGLAAIIATVLVGTGVGAPISIATSAVIGGAGWIMGVLARTLKTQYDKHCQTKGYYFSFRAHLYYAVPLPPVYWTTKNKRGCVANK
jgi:hypothetical protein